MGETFDMSQDTVNVSNRIYSLKYQRPTTSGSKDIKNKKIEFDTSLSFL